MERQRLQVSEVGPRDGLQSKPTLPALVRAELINRLSRCGVDRIEVGSFVSPRAVPQMAETEQVFAALSRVPGVVYSALVLNRRGAERAIALELDELHFGFVCTETFNQRNQGATIAESLDAFAAIVEMCRKAGMRISCGIGASFGCPFEGVVPTERVCGLAVEIARRGADEIVFADTIGVGVPSQVGALLAATTDALNGKIPVGFHFHDTRGTGLANADAALRGGASVLDASVGGLGGCPFAPTATGNIATEDLGYLMRQSGIETRLDLQALIDTGAWLADQLGQPMPGAIARAGLFPETARAPKAA